MNKEFEFVIGLEVHLQVKTESKMFCRCAADYFGQKPNSRVCPVCLGLPGALPVPNALAVKKCLSLCLATNCQINKISKFDRKNYFYPDLPKGYQISQYDLPLGENGFLEFDVDSDSRRVRIRRIHLEEDTGKSMHTNEETLLDFNKSGIPLIEIVTEPDFVDIEEVLAFAKRLRQTVRFLGISNADMEKGQMRYELNMSLRKVGSQKLPQYKVEVKNIGSISVLEKVIKYEFERQADILASGKLPTQETRGLRDLSGKTYSQRIKEDADDYRYFPEPDIPPMHFSDEYLEEIKSSICELPQARKHRYVFDYKLEPDTAEVLISSKVRSDWFEEAIEKIKDTALIKEIAKWLIKDVNAIIKEQKLKLSELKFTPKQFSQLVEMLYQKKLSGTLAKQVLAEMNSTGDEPEAIVNRKGLSIMADETELIKVIKTVFKDNANVVGDTKKNPNAAKFLLGQVMKATKGKADPAESARLIADLLSKE